MAMLTQSRTQRRAWKRDLALKNIDTIYGPLYKELDTMVAKIESFNGRSGYSSFDKAEWERIRRQYLYHLIGPPLNGQLDRLYALIDIFNQSIMAANVEAEKEVLRAATALYGTDELRVFDIRYCLSAYPGMEAPLALFIPAMFGEHPRDFLKAMYYDVKNPSFHIKVERSGPSGQAPSKNFTHPDELARFDKFFDEVSKSVQSLPPVVTLKTRVEEIGPLATMLRDSILKLIKEPLAI